MNIIKDIKDFQFSISNCILTLGNFDGVHLGHRHLLAQLKSLADQNGGLQTLIVTFSNHPYSVLFPQKKLELLSTNEEKINFFEKENLNNVYLLDFNEELSKFSALEFIETHVLPFKPKGVVIGREHFFGKNKEGNNKILIELGNKYGFFVHEVNDYLINGESVSSTRIRKSIIESEFNDASILLGYSYSFTGKVVSGNKVGSKIGYPTANIICEKNKLIPSTGIYAAYAIIDDKKTPGMLYIGNRPTFTENLRSIEIHLLDFNQNLYNKTITVQPVKFLRNDRKFEDLNELTKQISTDKKQTIKILNL